MKVEVSVECLPRVSQDRKDNWYVVVVYGNDEGEPPWNKARANSERARIEGVLLHGISVSAKL